MDRISFAIVPPQKTWRGAAATNEPISFKTLISVNPPTLYDVIVIGRSRSRAFST
jgi:hypothetical protein